MTYRSLLRIASAVGFVALFGARLDANTWYFQNTVLQGTFSGSATVTGFVSVIGTGVAANWGLPVNIVINGPFGSFTDNGSTLQLDEGTTGYADSFVDYIATQQLGTTSSTIVPLFSFSFTSAGFPTVDTYSLVSGNLVLAPEPETGPAALLAIALMGTILFRRRVI